MNKKNIRKEYLTVKEYAEMIGLCPHAITKRIRNNKALHGISEVNLMGRTFVLKVSDWAAIKK